MDLKKLMRSVGRGEKGFTLIELLVVVAILGVIAAVVVLNIGSFIGEGTTEAANTEAHQVQTAVVAAMANGSFSPGTVSSDSSDPTGAEAYLLNPGRLQCDYTIATDGSISGATPGGEFSDCSWTSGAWSC